MKHTNIVNFTIEQILDIEEISIDHLPEESLFQGFRFAERFIREYESGLNRFEPKFKITNLLLNLGQVSGISV